MSNPMAIAAVTATLRNLLAAAVTTESDLNDAVVTAQPLDKARDAAATTNQLNLFLYLISPNAAWRNHDMPGRTRPGEVASPPLALNLFYLLSSYGRDNDVEKPFSHLLLGQAMSILYDHPLLGADEITAALLNNDLGGQIERVRITLQPLTIEEISKLWAGFQMQYRLSVAYEVAVVLIDSQRGVRAAPPVLARGPAGRGFGSTADPLNAYPRLVSLSPSRPLRPAETLQITGTGLGDGAVTAQFTPFPPPPAAEALGAAPAVATSTGVQAPATRLANGAFSVAIPAGKDLQAGICQVSLLVPDAVAGQPPQQSNSLVFQLAPRITTKMPLQVALGSGNLAITLKIDPPVRAGQSVALILGNREILADSAKGATLRFTLSNVAAGSYMARVRVDGVDSLPILNPDATVPTFDPAQVIVVTA